MLFINATIFTMEKKEPDKNSYLQIIDGKFAAIGEMSDTLPQDDCIIDIGGKSIYPGFIDAHTHVGMFDDGLCFEGDDGNEDSDPSTPHLRAVDAVNSFDRCFSEAANAGVTSVLTGPGSSNPIAGQIAAVKTHGRYLDEMIIKAPIAMKMSLGENPKTTYSEKGESPVTRMATAAVIREQLFKTKRYLEEIEASEAGDGDAPEADFKCNALMSVLKGELPVHFHCHRRDDIITAMRIAKEFNLKYTLVHATEGYMIADILSENDVSVLSGPTLCDRSKPELANLSPAATGILDKNGVKAGIITDHPVIPIQYLPLCAGLCVREGMDETAALKAITINPACICGIDDRVGSIKVGKDADFTVFFQNPLLLSAKPDAVYINGKKVFDRNETK